MSNGHFYDVEYFLFIVNVHNTYYIKTMGFERSYNLHVVIRILIISHGGRGSSVSFEGNSE